MNDPIAAKLEDVLNLAPTEDKATSVPALVKEAKNELAEARKIVERADIIEDFQFARTKMISAISMGSEAMAELLELAKTSQGFEHYTAFAALLKSVNETNKNLLELHKDVNEVEAMAPVDDDAQSADPDQIMTNMEMVMNAIREGMGVRRGLDAAAQTLVLTPDDPGLQPITISNN